MELMYILETIWEAVTFAYAYWQTIICNMSRTQIAEICIYSAGILWGIELLPQIIKTYKTRNVKGISFAFFSMCLVAYSLYAFGNYLLGNWSILIAHAPSLVLNLWMVILIMIYRRKE